MWAWVTKIRGPETKAHLVGVIFHSWNGVLERGNHLLWAWATLTHCVEFIQSSQTPRLPRILKMPLLQLPHPLFPATKPLFILSTKCFDEDESELSSIISSHCSSKDFNQSSACSASEATNSSDEVEVREDWIHTAFEEQPVEFFQEMVKQTKMVDAMGSYCFNSQPHLPAIPITKWRWCNHVILHGKYMLKQWPLQHILKMLNAG